MRTAALSATLGLEIGGAFNIGHVTKMELEGLNKGSGPRPYMLGKSSTEPEASLCHNRGMKPAASQAIESPALASRSAFWRARAGSCVLAYQMASESPPGFVLLGLNIEQMRVRKLLIL